MFIAWLHAFLFLMISGTLIRFIEQTFPDTGLARALGYIYG